MATKCKFCGFEVWPGNKDEETRLLRSELDDLKHAMTKSEFVIDFTFQAIALRSLMSRLGYCTLGCAENGLQKNPIKDLEGFVVEALKSLATVPE